MDNSLGIWVQTRGREVDYGFLGSAPEALWWRVYNRAIDPTQPGAAVESEGGHWKIYLTGIPSSRRDKVNTQIRYTLVLSGAAPEPAVADSATVLLRNWLAITKDNDPTGPLSTALDEQFDEETVVSLRERRDDDAAAEATRRALDALGQLVGGQAANGEAAADGADRRDLREWIGDLRQAAPRAAWLARAANLLRGELGRALVLNLAESREDLRDLKIPDDAWIAILLTASNPPLRDLESLTRPKVPPPLPPSPIGNFLRNITNSRRKKVLVFGGIAGALCIVIWIIRSLN